MALTNAQIVSLCCQIAKCPGFISQAGQLLNVILDNLCQNYDFEIAAAAVAFNFDLSKNGGTGPFALPADFLRANKDEVLYVINGVRYVMISVELSEYNAMTQTAGFSGFPTYFAVDTSFTPPNMYVWPPANGAYPVYMRYQRQMPTIVTPETSNAAPWFPNSMYLVQELSGRLCMLSGDARAEAFMSDDESAHPMGSNVILRKYLKLQGDTEGRAKTVTLDRRRFGAGFNQLKNTKQIGW